MYNTALTKKNNKIFQIQKKIKTQKNGNNTNTQDVTQTTNHKNLPKMKDGSSEHYVATKISRNFEKTDNPTPKIRKVTPKHLRISPHTFKIHFLAINWGYVDPNVYKNKTFEENCNFRLAEVGKLESPKLSGKYETGQLILHRVFGYRGVVLFPWLARVYDRDLPQHREGDDEPNPGVGKEVRGRTHTFYQVLIDQRDCPYIVSGCQEKT